MDIASDTDADTSEGKWLTYEELAELRRIDVPSAIKLASRHPGWPKRKSNTGLQQGLVPVDWYERAKGRWDRYGDKSPDVSGIAKAFELAVTSLSARAAAAEARTEVALADLKAEREARDRTTAELTAALADKARVEAEARELFRRIERLERRPLSRLAKTLAGWIRRP